MRQRLLGQVGTVLAALLGATGCVAGTMADSEVDPVDVDGGPSPDAGPLAPGPRIVPDVDAGSTPPPPPEPTPEPPPEPEPEPTPEPPPDARRYPAPDPALGESGESSTDVRTLSHIEVLSSRAVRFYFRGNALLDGRSVHEMKLFLREGSSVRCLAWIEYGPMCGRASATFEGFEPGGRYYVALKYDDGTSTTPEPFEMPDDDIDAAPPRIARIARGGSYGVRSVDVDVTDDVGVARVEFFFDGADVPIQSLEPVGFRQLPADSDAGRFRHFVSTTVTGTHRVRVRVIDFAGRASEREESLSFDAD